MCRYTEHHYKCKWACFSCRSVFKDTCGHDGLYGQSRGKVCPSCGAAMVDLGQDFQAPRKTQGQQWKKVQILYERHGLGYHSCGCTGPGPRPRTLQDLRRAGV